MGTRYVRCWLPGLARSLRAKEMYMSSRTGNWMIAIGAFGMFIGLCLVPAAMGPNSDSSVLALAACVFSFGALITASGMYLKARGLQLSAKTGHFKRKAHLQRSHALRHPHRRNLYHFRCNHSNRRGRSCHRLARFSGTWEASYLQTHGTAHSENRHSSNSN